MDKICPVCNELSIINVICNKCNKSMEDKGRVEDYLDNYSADMPIEGSNDYCTHIYECLYCNYFKRVKLDKVNL